MWKDSFTSRLRVFLGLFMLLVVVEAVLVITDLNSTNDVFQIKSDIQNIEFIFLFIIFLLSVMIFFYVPLLLHRKLKDINNVLKEVTEGNYSPEIDFTKFEQDKEFSFLLAALQKMLQVVVKFDQLKADKIMEHNNRILGLLNLANNGFIVIADSGDVIYTNDLMKDNFSEFQQNTNFFDDILSGEIEKLIKPYIIEILRSGSKGKDMKVFFESMGKEITVKSYIVRDEAGEPIGTVMALYGLPENQDKILIKDKM